MSCSARAHRARPLALAVLAGTTTVTGTLVTALPALAAPVAIEAYATEMPVGTPATGADHYFHRVTLSNGDTAYGINEDQPLAPAEELVLDDEDYTVAEPLDDPEGGWRDVVGEKVGDHPVYWEPEKAALAGYILSVFGATEDADEALAVHWAVRSLATADSPAPERSGLQRAHLERAEVMLEEARATVAFLAPRDSYRTDIVVDATGRPTHLTVQLPEIYEEVTVTLEGPVTFADGTATQHITGGPREQELELVVDEGATVGRITAELAATMPSTELVVLADDEHRDLFIAGQDRTVTWSADAAFAITESARPGDDVRDGQTPAPDGKNTSTPADEGTDQHADGADETAGPGADGGAESDVDETAGSGADRSVRPVVEGPTGPVTDGDPDDGTGLPWTVSENETGQKVTTSLEAFVLFEEQTSTHTEVVTETTTSLGAGGAAYADVVMADTGMGASQPAGARSAGAPVLLAVMAVAAGLGSWALRRRTPSGRAKHATVS
ncbi:hypothetical protein [Kocuria rosea]|uniref:hypothetical protein n=1 Tax=Kocuria rosea TaxID=1275 RepID=UPI00203FE898|nr:hypothetical protein [Kocuria rosea]MCM3688707.1 hypothetical protein [Kocuria rosea]